MLSALGVGLLYWCVQSQLQVSLDTPEAAQTYLAASLGLAVLGLFLLLSPERGIFNLYGLASSLLFGFLVLVCWQLASWLPDFSEASANYYLSWPTADYVMSWGASLLVGFAAIVGIAVLLMRNSDTEAAMLGAFAALYISLAWLQLEYISVAMGTAAGLCVVWGLLRSSHAMAYRDDLTGLLGRRALNERLKTLGRNYGIAMLDVDHFKRFNDTHGHDVGDEVLRLVASRIRQVGNGGTAYRYGGEEFCIVFPRKPVEDCAEALDSVREEIAGYQMSIRNRSARPSRKREGARRRGATRLNGKHVSVTVSVGVAGRTPELTDPEAVVMAADSNLYRAKRAGRNRVVF